MRIWLAIRCFWKVLLDGEFARRIVQLDEGMAPQAEPERSAVAVAKPPAAPRRSEAITLLAALQREARFVDIVCEPLDAYSDAQIGAAARDVLRDAGQVLDRLFGLQPVVDDQEGSQVNVPAGYDAARFRLTGNVSLAPPISGELMHAGWRATKCDLPAWTGSDEAALVVAPAEVQVG